MLGTVGQVAGVLGIVVCLLLVIGVIIGDVWAVRTVDDVAAAIDAKIAKADPLLTQASAKVGEISGRVSTVADIAAGIAADPSPGGAVADTLRAGSRPSLTATRPCAPTTPACGSRCSP